jgi:hypothetical protein
VNSDGCDDGYEVPTVWYPPQGCELLATYQENGEAVGLGYVRFVDGSWMPVSSALRPGDTDWLLGIDQRR